MTILILGHDKRVKKGQEPEKEKYPEKGAKVIMKNSPRYEKRDFKKGKREAS